MPKGRRPIEEITDKQRDTLKFIIDFVQKNGFQPSRQEMAMEIGATRHSATQRVWYLRDKGFVNAPPEGGERCLALRGIRFKAELDPAGLSDEHRQVLEEILAELNG